MVRQAIHNQNTCQADTLSAPNRSRNVLPMPAAVSLHAILPGLSCVRSDVHYGHRQQPRDGYNI